MGDDTGVGSQLHYHPTSDQLLLASELGGAIDALLPPARAQLGGAEGESIWERLAELGVLSACVAEDRGGSGLGATEQVLIATALGRRLAAPAVFATMATMGAAADLSGGSEARIAAALPGDAPLWVDEPGATLLLVRQADGATLHAMPDDRRTIDEDSWAARLVTGPIGSPLVVLDDRTLLRLRLVDAAALAGIAGAVLDMAVDYAKLREQFGRAIGSFQAIKHHCANMAIAARSAQDLTNCAAVALDEGRAEAPRLIASAFLVAAHAAIDNAGLNIQIHGGIGFSAEAEPHLYLKRAQLLAGIGGGVGAATDRLTTAIVAA